MQEAEHATEPVRAESKTGTSKTLPNPFQHARRLPTEMSLTWGEPDQPGKPPVSPDGTLTVYLSEAHKLALFGPKGLDLQLLIQIKTQPAGRQPLPLPPAETPIPQEDNGSYD